MAMARAIPNGFSRSGTKFSFDHFVRCITTNASNKGFTRIHRQRIVWISGRLILIRDFKNWSEWSILNAVTMEKLQVPTLVEHEWSLFDNFLLYGSPNEVNCTVFVINSTDIFYCKIGANKFCKQTKAFCLRPIYRAITIFQGRMYYIEHGTYSLLNSGQLEGSSALQFEDCIYGFELEDQLLFGRGGHYYLLECDDHLLCVCGRSLEMGVMDFQVFRADLSEKVWEEIHNIGSDRAIFIDEFKGFSADVPPGGLFKGNCIYYMSELDWDDVDCNFNLFSFDLEDGFVTTLPILPFKIHRENPQSPLLPQTIWINCFSPN